MAFVPVGQFIIENTHNNGPGQKRIHPDVDYLGEIGHHPQHPPKKKRSGENPAAQIIKSIPLMYPQGVVDAKEVHGQGDDQKYLDKLARENVVNGNISYQHVIRCKYADMQVEKVRRRALFPLLSFLECPIQSTHKKATTPAKASRKIS